MVNGSRCEIIFKILLALFTGKDYFKKALFLNKFGKRIGEHYIRTHLKEITVETGINKRIYPHMILASSITHMLNEGTNPLTVQLHARHKDFRTTMVYNRPTLKQMKSQLESVFVKRPNLSNDDRKKEV